MESFTRPAHRKKRSNANENLTFSFKNAYDDVLSAPAKEVPKFKAPSGVNDYVEVFGGGSRVSSVPVIDLSALDQKEDFRSSKVDYLKVFGRFGDEYIALPYEELLRIAENEGKFSYDKARRHQSYKESPLQGSENGNSPGKNEVLSSKASAQSLDGSKQFNVSDHMISQRSEEGTTGTKGGSKLHAVPGFTFFVNETPHQQRAEGDVPSVKSEVHRTWSFSGELHEGNNSRKTETNVPNILTSEGVVRGKDRSWWDGSQSNDKLCSASEITPKSYSLKTSSSRPANLNDNKGPPKQPESVFSSRVNPFENTAADYLTCSSDEEIDTNPDAATLKRVVEKAKETIRRAAKSNERIKDLRGLSKLSCKASFEIKDRKVSRIDREAKSVKENNDKGIGQRSNHIFQGLSEINRRVTSRNVVATTFEHSKKLSTLGEAQVEEHLGNVTEGHAEATFLFDLVNKGKHQNATLASREIENKNTLFLSPDNQANDLDETKIAEQIMERIENNVEKTKAIKKEFGPGNTENKVIVDKNAQESMQTVYKSDFAPIVHEYGESENLTITQVDILAEDIQNGFDKCGEYEKKSRECLQMTEGKKLELLRSEDDNMLKQSKHLVKDEKEPFEAFQVVGIGMKSEDVHDREEIDNEFGNSCSKGGFMVLEEACLFVENADKSPKVYGSGICEKACKDTQDREDCEVSDIDQERENDEMELIHAHNVGETQSHPEEKLHANEVAELDLNEKESIHPPDGAKYKMLTKEHEGEEVQKRAEETYNYVDADENIPEEEIDWEDVEELDLSEKESIHPPDGAKYKILTEEHEGEEVQKRAEETYNYVDADENIPEEVIDWEDIEELDLNEKESIHPPDGVKCKMLKEEDEGKEFQKQHEDTYNYVDADDNLPEEFDWEEVEKRIKEACINEATENSFIKADKNTENQNVKGIQEVEDAESIHFKAGDSASNQEIHLLQKAGRERDSDIPFDAFSNENAVENCEDNSSTPGGTKAFYICEVDANEGEESVKEAPKLEDKNFESPYQEHLSQSKMPSATKAIDSDENGANFFHGDMEPKQKVSKENVLETADEVQNAVKENEIDIKMQYFSEAYPGDEKATVLDSSKESMQKEMEENVKERGLSFSSESDGVSVHNSVENAEDVEETEIAFDKKDEKINLEVVHKQRNIKEDLKKAESTPLTSQPTVNLNFVGTGKEMKRGQSFEAKERRETLQREVKEKDNSRTIEVIRRERKIEKDRIAVERAIREARERAFADAKERAERAAVERAAAEVRQRAMAEAKEKHEKATAGTQSVDKASIDAKLKAERAAVERATAEARERALEKALSQKSTSRDNGLKQSYSSSNVERLDGTNSESAQRRKAKSERNQRIMERVEKALAEKNKRDRLAEKEQAERNRLAESVEADIKRWASGKEGNLRALLSTLQYILGPDSGWQPIPLSEIITTSAVKKAYRKATLYVHPDKVQQRGASIKQKYICEKVFDLLKAAWSRL